MVDGSGGTASRPPASGSGMGSVADPGQTLLKDIKDLVARTRDAPAPIFDALAMQAKAVGLMADSEAAHPPIEAAPTGAVGAARARYTAFERQIDRVVENQIRDGGAIRAQCLSGTIRQSRTTPCRSRKKGGGEVWRGRFAGR